jgi:hypothetical protein
MACLIAEQYLDRLSMVCVIFGVPSGSLACYAKLVNVEALLY